MLSGIVAVSFVFRFSAHAQVELPLSTPSNVERVIILRHEIPITETESALRVFVYTAEFMQKNGANTPIEGLRQLPLFVGTTETENDSNGGDGSAFINLYALGSNNVLTLINGRRAFSFSDINAIPIAARLRRREAQLLRPRLCGNHENTRSRRTSPNGAPPPAIGRTLDRRYGAQIFRAPDRWWQLAH
jgi:hypothetical protein